MMAVPFVVFCVLIVTGRKELGWKGIAIFVAIWASLLAAVMALRIDPHFFIAAQAVLDAVLLAVIYLGFTRLR
jgi:uncharacterized membrane protein YGL010W